MKTRKVEIHGQVVTLVTRKCAGCSRFFEVTTRAKNKYHSMRCAELATGKRRYDFYFGFERVPEAIAKAGIVGTEED